MLLLCVGCEVAPEPSPISCVTLRCDGSSTGWTSCYYACGDCIDSAHAVRTSDRIAVCSF